MAQIKGTAIRGLLKHAREGGFPGGIPGAIAALPPATRALLERKVLASSWYPYGIYGELLSVIDERQGKGRPRFLLDLGRWLARQDAGTTFKIVAMFASVETMLERGSLFWTRHCDTGTFTTVDVQPGQGTGLLERFPDVHPLHCQLLSGWIEGMGMAAGAQSASVDKVRCVHRGDSACEYRGRWT